MNRTLAAVLKEFCSDSSDDAFSSEDEQEYFTDSSTSSDSSLDEERAKIRKIDRNSKEETENFYTDKEFQEHYRLKRSTTDYIIDLIDVDGVLPKHTFGRKAISSKKAVLLTIWYLGNSDTFQQVSDKFNITKSSAHKIVNKIVDYLVENSSKHIKWPNEEGKTEIKKGFKCFQGIDGILGALDVCHINIKKPIHDDEAFYNRKSEYSILLQGICDNRKKFLDVFCGEAGSLHETCILKKSSIYERCVDGFLGNNFLLGSSAYPCLEWIIPPFEDNANLSSNQRKFNEYHWSSRIVIKDAFGLLKSRFRRLRHFENGNIVFIVKCVVAATVLHNICVDLDDEVEFENEEEDSDYIDEQTLQNISGILPVYKKRNVIFQRMFYNV